MMCYRTGLIAHPKRIIIWVYNYFLPPNRTPDMFPKVLVREKYTTLYVDVLSILVII